MKTYIPIIKNILPPLVKAMSLESEMKPEHFLDAFYFQLQALRMLAAICGEFEAHFTQLSADKNLLKFLNFCRVDIRNIMAEIVDLIESQNCLMKLIALVSEIDEKKLDKAKPKKPNPSAFFGANSPGSAMDIKYDKKPPAAGKGMR